MFGLWSNIHIKFGQVAFCYFQFSFPVLQGIVVVDEDSEEFQELGNRLLLPEFEKVILIVAGHGEKVVQGYLSGSGCVQLTEDVK